MAGWSIVSESDAPASSAKGASGSGDWTVVDEKSPEELKFENAVGNAAVASVPKPAFLSYQPTEIDPLNVRGQGKGLQPVRTPRNVPTPSGWDVIKAVAGGSLPQSEMPFLPGVAPAMSAAESAKAGKGWETGSHLLEGASEVATPFVGPALGEVSAAASLPAALKFGAGVVASTQLPPVAQAISKKLGAGPAQQTFWANLAAWAPLTYAAIRGSSAGGAKAPAETPPAPEGGGPSAPPLGDLPGSGSSGIPLAGSSGAAPRISDAQSQELADMVNQLPPNMRGKAILEIHARTGNQVLVPQVGKNGVIENVVVKLTEAPQKSGPPPAAAGPPTETSLLDAAVAQTAPAGGQIQPPIGPAPFMPPPGPIADAANSMARAEANATQAKMRAAGIEPPAPPMPAPPPRAHEVPDELVKKVGDKIVALPPDQRAPAIIDAHEQLAKHLLEQGKIVVNGKLEIIKNPDQADSAAQKLINDEIAERDKVAAAVSSKPASASSGEGVGAGITKARAGLKKAGGFEVVSEEPKGVVSADGTPQNGAISGSGAPTETGATVRVPMGPPGPKGTELQGAGARENEQLPSGVYGRGANGNESQRGKETDFEVVHEEPRTQKFAKGEKVVLPDGRSGTVDWIGTNPQGKDIARVRDEKGVKTSVEASTLKSPTSEPITGKTPLAAEGNAPQHILWSRHGETELDVDATNETVAGWTKEPLDDRGIASAHKLAGEVRDHKPTVIISSDLERAKQTADIVGKELGIPVKTDERLRPQHVPETEGLKVGAAKPIWQDFEDNPTKKPEGGESWKEFEDRQAGAIKDIHAMVAQGERPMVVTHSRNLESAIGERPEPGEFVKKQVEKPERTRPSEYGPPKKDFEGKVPLENLGFNMAPAEDRGNQARAEVERRMGGPLPRGATERRTSEAKGQETTSMVPQGRKEAGAKADAVNQSTGTAGEAGPEPKYKFGNTQAPIHPDSEAAKSLETARARISDSDLAGKGKDVDGNHVTVRYGIQDDDTGRIKKFLSQQAPFEASLGKTESFPPSEHSDGAAVIQAPIEAPELHRLNSELEKHGNFTEPSFKEYKPHATIAYVKPERTERYINQSVTEGKKFTVREVQISDRQGNKEIVKLEGKGVEGSGSSQGAPIGVTKAVGKPADAALAQQRPAEVAPGKVGEMKLSDLKVNADRYQYKLGTDAEGVGTLLKNTDVFNPDLAGVISVWRDPADGKTYVINGHHRYELAKRLGQKTVVVRHVVAKSVAEARAIGALQNIAEGRGTAVDAAKFFRDSGLTPDDLKAKGISLGEKTAADGLAMSRLDPSIFAKVVSGDLRQGRAIAIGESTEDPAEQKAILSLVERKERGGAKVSDGTLSELIRLVKGAQQTTETTANLFGSQEITRSLALEKAEISDYIKTQLSKDKKLFGFVAKEGRANELARAGNKIDVEKSKEISTGAAQAEEVYNKLSARGGPIASILDEAARKLADGESAGTVKSEAYRDIRAEVSKTLGSPEGTSAGGSEAAPKGDQGLDLFSGAEPLKAPAFYSKAERIADQKVSTGSGSSVLATLKNNGVKEDEIKWLGLDDFLKDKPRVTKAELQQHIRENSLQIQEVALDQKQYPEKPTWDGVGGLVNNRRGVKYEQYTLPGDKQNYTELLLQLPLEPAGGNPYSKIVALEEKLADAESARTNYLQTLRPVPGDVELRFHDAQTALRKARNELDQLKPFQSSHFDEPNIVAHVRFDGRTDADGKKVLLVEEVQSDWHQKGKKVGYRDPNAALEAARLRTVASQKRATLAPLLKLADDLGYDTSTEILNDIARGAYPAEHIDEAGVPGLRAAASAYREAHAAWQEAQTASLILGVPDAPFKSDWHELAMKRMLRAAAENGYDKLAWTTGEQQNDRYDLSMHVQEVRAFKRDNDTYDLTVQRKDGGTDDIGTRIAADKLPDYVGKELADKIVSGQGVRDQSQGKWQYFSGLDLKIGGTGMKGFYDKILPDFLNKYGKKWGVKVGESKLGGTGRTDKRVLDEILREDFGTTWAAATEGQREWAKERQGGTTGQTKVHSIDVTPEMKKSVMEEGQPLFRQPTRPITAGVARGIDYEVVPTAKGLPPYIKVNPHAVAAISHTLGVEFLGVNLDKPSTIKVIKNLRFTAENAEKMGIKDGAKKLASFADTLEEALEKNPKEGVSLVREGGTELETVHEELLHAMQRRAGEGDIDAGVPWKAALKDHVIAGLAADLSDAFNQNGIEPHPAALVAEAMVDLLRGDASHLSPKAAEKAAEHYFESAAQQHGIEHLEDLQSVQDYIAGREEALNVTHDRKVLAIRRAGEEALARTIARRTGGQTGPTGKAIQGESLEKSGTANPATGTTDRGAPDNARTGREGLTPKTEKPAFSTQPVGLSDEELETWAKSKGFRYEPAGEQLGMFGGNDQLLRVFRQGPRGREQRGLIYESQLQKLQEAKPETTEPFALTGGETRDEQPRLFGAGDLGEIIGKPGAESGIKLPSKGGENTSLLRKSEKSEGLLSGESGFLEPGKLAEPVTKVAGAAGDYIRSEAHFNKIARQLHSGMYDLEAEHSGRVLEAVQTMEKVAKEYGDRKADFLADAEQVYHHQEDPTGIKLDTDQDELLDDEVLPLMEDTDNKFKALKEIDGQQAHLIDNYVHRVTKGKGGWLDRIVAGAKRGTGRGNLLSKSAPQTQGRTMMAIESPEGDRRVISIKGGKATMWDDGQSTELGEIKNAKGKSDVENETFPEGQPNSVFYDEGKIVEGPDGYDWKIVQATTKEIEANTGIQYYHNALASALVANLQVSKALRGAQFVEAFKASPQFKEVAFKGARPPDGWKITQLPQMKDYYFEPHVAEVLDWYAERLRGGDPSIMEKVGQFLRTSIFFNPLIHIPNITVHWAVERGLTGYNPIRLPAASRAGLKAINAVIHQNQDFLDALEAGAPLQSHREDVAKVTQLFFDQFTDGLEKKEDWAMEAAKKIGMSPISLIKAIYRFSGKATWVTNDIAVLQSAYEKMGRSPGMRLSDALKETSKHIPDYRLPTRMLNSRALAKVLSNPNISMFMAYHYGAAKSYGEAIKSATGMGGAGGEEPPSGGAGGGEAEPEPGKRSKAGEIAHGWELLATIGLVTFVLYPLLDKLVQAASGDKNAKMRRAGAATLPYNVYQAATHQKSVGDVVQSVATPAIQTKSAAELIANRDFFTGKNIYDSTADWETQGQQVGRFLAQTVSPIGQASRVAEGGAEARKRFGWGLVGVSFPKTRAERLAAQIAMGKTGTKAQSPEDREDYVERRDILEELRKGNRRPLMDAERTHAITPQQAATIKRRALRDPLADTVYNFSVPEVKKVLEAAKEDGNEKQVEILQRVIREKRLRMIQRGEFEKARESAVQ